MAAAPSFSDSRFTRQFIVPVDTIRGSSEPFKISYADYGYRNESNLDEENVFLFFPPLLGSRWMHIAKDEIAKRHKVRFINVERPGYGGTDEVQVQDRLQVWQDAIPALLKHLNIKHVSVGCHSAGTVYALDFILRHPQYLHPERPYLAIAGPWIPPAKSGVISMRVVQSLPAGMIGKTDSFARFMKSTVGPAIGASAAAVSGLLSVVARGTDTSRSDEDPVEGVSGADLDDGRTEFSMRPELLSKAYSESLQGMGVDAVLMMGKAPDAAGTGAFAAGWSDWGDYEAYVPRLVEVLRGAGRRLTVAVFHAEKDSMVGDYGQQGQLWFDECWAEQRCGDGVITYGASCVEGADHDLVWNIKYGVPGQVFRKIGTQVEGPSAAEETES